MNAYLIEGDVVRRVRARKCRLVVRYVRYVDTGVTFVYLDDAIADSKRAERFIRALARADSSDVAYSLIRGLIRELLGHGRYRVIVRDEAFGEEDITLDTFEERIDVWSAGSRIVIEVYRL